MFLSLEGLRGLKELMLFVSVVYFYILAVALFFHLPTMGLDHPVPFIAAGTIFLIALGIEVLLSWWNKRRFVMWVLLWVAVYAIIGFFVAPVIFGPSVLLYVYVEPVLIIFIGGFALSFAYLFTGVILPEQKLSAECLDREMKRMPGWSVSRGALLKKYLFKTEDEALAFVVRVSQIADRMHYHPKIQPHKTLVVVRFSSSEKGGITRRDIREAIKIDASAL